LVGIVRIALSRPLTFIVMAILILILGVLSVLRMPVDIFPDIRLPVIAIAWTYNGLSPEDVAGRVITPYERALNSTVNDIEHIESQSLPFLGRNFFPAVDAGAMALHVRAPIGTRIEEGAAVEAERAEAAAADDGAEGCLDSGSPPSAG